MLAKQLVSGLVLVGLAATSVSAETIRPGDAVLAQQSQTAPSTATPTASEPEQAPPPARPSPRRRNSFFGLPLIGLLALGGAGGTAALLASDDSSPQ